MKYNLQTLILNIKYPAKTFIPTNLKVKYLKLLHLQNPGPKNICDNRKSHKLRNTSTN